MTFEEFFETVTGHQPFDWQVAVANYLCHNQWYECLGTPPATGKTSLVEIWYYALYSNIINSPNKRHIPLRFWYTVDRKIIVDAAYEAAVNLAKKLKNDPKLIELGKVVQDYFGCDDPLFVGKIRGGMDRDDKNRWLTANNSPIQPSVISSTVDQIGSRLLFRGYGVSPKVRSIHAAMAGMDSLVALDEAHLSQSLKKVLNVVTSDYKLENIPETRVIELTATGTNQNVFPVKQIVENDKRLAKRLSAKRNITLFKSPKSLVPSLVAKGKELALNNNVVAIICNTVATARDVFKNLKNLKNTNAILLIGRVRGHERDAIYEKYAKNLLSKRDRKDDKPLFVVSTQTIEVGADFDFDAMVTQAAPLDCLIQRFGRLDRIGNIGNTNGVIVYKSSKEKDKIYGEVTKSTFEWLEAQYAGGFDIGQVIRNTYYYAKINHIAELTPGILDILALTHPGTAVDIEGLLHGVKTNTDSDFQLVYRKEITEANLQNNQAKKWLDMKYPIQNQEILTLPIHVLYKKSEGSDTAIMTDDVSNLAKTDITEKLCLRYRDKAIIQMKYIVPGDLVIVPMSFGQYDEFGWDSESEIPVNDVSDYYSPVIRLHPDWLPGFNIKDYKKPTLDVKIDIETLLDKLNNELIPNWLNDPELTVLAKSFQRKLKVAKFWPEVTPDKKGIYLHPLKKAIQQDKQKLNAHNAKVGSNARKFAEKLGFSEEMIAILERSGQCHDLGKADPRFQKVLAHPNFPTDFLAKSTGYNRKVKAEYPLGWRHELQSLVMILENNLGVELDDEALFQHLVASHHGWFRNFIPLTIDDSFRPFNLDGKTCSRHYLDIYSSYDRNNFSVLNEKYGYWGLALLESIIRLSDWTN